MTKRGWRAFVLVALLAGGALAAYRVGGGGVVDGNRVQCANLVYAGNRTSVCFSNRFLQRLDAETHIRTDLTLYPVRLDDARRLADFPFAVMTGEGPFTLAPAERTNLRYYLTHGGFLVASAGCSSAAWARSFQREFAALFPGRRLTPIPLSHPLFRTVYLIRSLETANGLHGRQALLLEGYSVDGRLALVFSPEGLNDTSHAQHCCCCGGDEIANAEFVNVDLLAYAVLH